MSSQLSRLCVVIVLFAFVMSNVSPLMAADKMTYEEYQSRLQAFMDREAKAKTEMDAVQGEIDKLQAQIADITAQIKAVWSEIYAMAGVDEAELVRFEGVVAALEDRVNELARLRPQELLERAKELDEILKEIEALKMENAAQLSSFNDRLNQLAMRVERLKQSLPKPQHDMYTVVRGDYLWRISGKSQIYSDPMKWMRIYSANREEIRDPDLIYPDQRFRIPRQIGRDEHLVTRGEYLVKIAGLPEVYGNPFEWTKIYEANKVNGFIEDPNLIYPEQILSIPRN
ncbi:LysM peptidoglycan-binding domain-containing protein [Calditrichota bacterium]